METAIKNISGSDAGRSASLSSEVFAIEPNEHVVWLDVRHYLANQRQGTHKTKERSELSGSTRKLRKQKGAGAARVGDIKSPVLRGGARVFGPSPRDYDFKLNVKTKKLARKSVLTSRAKDDKIMLVEDFSFDKPGTKQFVELLAKLELTDKKMLLVTSEYDKNIYLSARNIPKVNVVSAETLNTYALIDTDTVVICEGALEKIESSLK